MTPKVLLFASRENLIWKASPNSKMNGAAQLLLAIAALISLTSAYATDALHLTSAPCEKNAAFARVAFLGGGRLRCLESLPRWQFRHRANLRCGDDAENTGTAPFQLFVRAQKQRGLEVHRVVDSSSSLAILSQNIIAVWWRLLSLFATMALVTQSLLITFALGRPLHQVQRAAQIAIKISSFPPQPQDYSLSFRRVLKNQRLAVKIVAFSPRHHVQKSPLARNSVLPFVRETQP
jgi:hypothetical protein